MDIFYKINKLNHRITFCHDKQSPDILKDLSNLFSDKKMLVIIEEYHPSKYQNVLTVPTNIRVERKRKI